MLYWQIEFLWNGNKDRFFTDNSNSYDSNANIFIWNHKLIIKIESGDNMLGKKLIEMKKVSFSYDFIQYKTHVEIDVGSTLHKNALSICLLK